MLIKDIIGYDTYQFSQYIYELAAVIRNDTQTLVLCNLLNKLCNYTDATTKTHQNGKQYHFYHSQKDIFTNELFIKKDKYEKAIKVLNEKGFISSFSAKQPQNKLIDITYFYINISKVKEVFEQGYKIIHKVDPQQLTVKPAQKNKTTTGASKFTVQQQTELKKIENDFKAGFITPALYKMRKERITKNNNVN